jgi:hypothetical protein
LCSMFGESDCCVGSSSKFADHKFSNFCLILLSNWSICGETGSGACVTVSI